MNRTKRNQLIAVVIASVIIVLGVVSAVYLYNQKEAELLMLESKNQNLSEVIQERDSVVNDLVDAFTDIEKNLKFIKEKRKQLSIETDKEGGFDRKQEILDDIALMNEMLEESSKKIAQLEKKLKNSGFELRAFKKKISQLNETIELQNTQIASLKTELEKREVLVADLNNRVDELSVEIANQSEMLENKEKVIEEKIGELNKAYMAYGTFKELKEKGVISKHGGFLGIGSSKTILEDFDQEYFTELNIQDTKMIPLHAKKAVIVSEHPNNSYKFIEEDGLVSYLQIENPNEFWRISKYAVIEVK